MKKLPLFTSILVLNSLIFTSCSTAGGNTNTPASFLPSAKASTSTPSQSITNTTTISEKIQYKNQSIIK